MGESTAMLLDWAIKEERDLRVFTFDFNKFFDRIVMELYEALVRGMGLPESMIQGLMNYFQESKVFVATFLGVLDPIKRTISTPQGSIRSSDVAKVIGMVLQIGILEVEEAVHIGGTVEAPLIDGDVIGVAVDRMGEGIDMSLGLYCDDGSEVGEGGYAAAQKRLGNLSLVACFCRVSFKGPSVGVRGPYCEEGEEYVVFGVGLNGGLEEVKVQTVIQDIAGERLLGTDIQASRLWGGGGGGRRYRSVGGKVGRLMSMRFSIDEIRVMLKSVVIPQTIFGVATSGVIPEMLAMSDTGVSVVERLIGMDQTCTRLPTFASRKAGGMCMSSVTVETLGAAARELNVVLGGVEFTDRELGLKEKMWRYMVAWGSYQFVRADESMVVAVFRLLGVYGIQVLV